MHKMLDGFFNLSKYNELSFEKIDAYDAFGIWYPSIYPINIIVIYIYNCHVQPPTYSSTDKRPSTLGRSGR
jgi:hypothetical protein